MIDPNTETYAVGDVLKKTPFYSSIYVTWSVTEGTVVSVKKTSVPDAIMGKEDKSVYRSRYGIQQEYPVFAIMLKAPDGQTYLVSQLGFNHDGN